jgi:hypothetical protein
MPVERDVHGLDEHQGKMRRNNCQWQQPTVTAYRSPAPLRSASAGVHDHRNRCSRSTGLAVHDHRNPQQEVWGLLLAHFAVRGLMHEAALQADEDPDRLSFSHAVRVVRRKLPQFAALPPSGQACPA